MAVHSIDDILYDFYFEATGERLEDSIAHDAAVKAQKAIYETALRIIGPGITRQQRTRLNALFNREGSER